MEYILNYWYVWVIGLFVFPLIAVLTQINNIRAAIDDMGRNPEKIGKLFITPSSIFTIVIGGMGTFVCLILFCVSLILGIINYIKH